MLKIIEKQNFSSVLKLHVKEFKNKTFYCRVKFTKSVKHN